ncbi:hypothetical protein V1506DRAFT_521160 [Lipomyces tetrasporus]
MAPKAYEHARSRSLFRSEFKRLPSTGYGFSMKPEVSAAVNCYQMCDNIGSVTKEKVMNTQCTHWRGRSEQMVQVLVAATQMLSLNVSALVVAIILIVTGTPSDVWRGCKRLATTP